MGKLYALLVGIDEYAPASRVSKLSGCVNDVRNLQKILQKNYALQPQHTRLLTNKEATRAAIIAAFAEAAKNTQEGDTFLFAYSGHGSQERAAKEFLPYFPSGKNESIVCYDSRLPDGYDLADKELAVLLHDVSGKGVHTVLLMDCCHAGSISRIVDNKVRQARYTSPTSEERPLSSYANGYYSAQLAQTGKIQLPPAFHIALAACHSSERAWEAPTGQGTFSDAYQKILQEQPEISYMELFERTRDAVARTGEPQRPQIENYGVAVYNAFLSNKELAKPQRVHVSCTDQQNWFLSLGAVHGLSSAAPTQSLRIRLYRPKSKEILTEGTILRVNLQNSLLEIDNPTALSTQQSYEAELPFLVGNPVKIYLEGSDEHKQIFRQASNLFFQNAKSDAFFREADSAAAADYLLRLRDEHYALHFKDGSLLHGFAASTPHNNPAARYHGRCIAILLDIEKLAHWQKTADIDNPQTRLNRQDVDFQLVITDTQGSVHYHEQGDIALLYRNATAKFNAEIDGLAYSVRVRNRTGRDLYAELLFLGYDFAVEHKTSGEKFLPADKSDWRILVEDEIAFLADHLDTCRDLFKLFISTTSINLSIKDLEQRRINIGAIEQSQQTFKGTMRRQAPDWFCATLGLQLYREHQRLQTNRSVQVGELLAIDAHAQLQAVASLQPAAQSRSIDPIAPQLNLPQLAAFEPLPALLLGDIQGTGDSRELAQPLTLRIKTEEQLLAIAIDENGDPVVLAASHIDDEGRACLPITQLPDMPESEQQRTRSLGKALKLYFYKITGWRKDQVFQLRYVDYSSGSEAQRSGNSQEVAQKVAQAQRILVLIHGIIGDTQGMAQGLQFSTEGEKPRFDVVLTFDYGSLNIPIETIAENFKEQLQAAGIHANDGKEVVILAHSMGGLVSRYMIEKLDGDAFIDHLVMAGTPNNGSAFGKIEQYRQLFSTALGFSLGFFAWATAAIGATLSALTGLGQLTVTLGQMCPDSAFLKPLNNSFTCPPVPYTIIAGDINHPDFGAATLGARLLNKLGNLVNKSTPNDIAVDVQSILFPHTIAQTRCQADQRRIQTFPVIACTHLNYFDDPDSLAVLRQIFAPA